MSDQIRLDELHDLQWEASKRDKSYWFETFYRILSMGDDRQGIVPFRLRPYQRAVVESIDAHKFNIGLKARQIGWTTIAMAYALHDAIFNEFHPWLLVSRNEEASQLMLAKAKVAYWRLPDWMRERIGKPVTETQSVLEFANGSRIQSVPATASTGRGDSVYGTLLDEGAFMEYAEEIWAAVEPLTYGKAMIFSTANGMGNFFHDIWLDSQQPDSVWNGIFFPWDVVPERDHDWYEIKKRSYRGREWFFFQEYPSTPEEAFAKSGRVAFPYDDLKHVFEEMEPVLQYEWNIASGAIPVKVGEEVDIPIKVWKPPHVERDEHNFVIRKPNYVVGADIAEGLEHGDYTYVTVFDANTGEQVAASKSSIPVSYAAELILWLGEWYHNALVIPERNMAGIMVCERLGNDFWYPRMYRMDTFAQLPSSSDRTPRYGWNTDRKSKSKMVLDFALAVGERQIIIHDPDFLIEAQTFVADGKGSYAATSNNHDDVVMGTLVTWQGVLDSPHYPIIFHDHAIKPITWDEFDALSNPVPEVPKVELPLGRKLSNHRVKKSFLVV